MALSSRERNSSSPSHIAPQVVHQEDIVAEPMSSQPQSTLPPISSCRKHSLSDILQGPEDSNNKRVRLASTLLDDQVPLPLATGGPEQAEHSKGPCDVRTADRLDTAERLKFLVKLGVIEEKDSCTDDPAIIANHLAKLDVWITTQDGRFRMRLQEHMDTPSLSLLLWLLTTSVKACMTFKKSPYKNTEVISAHLASLKANVKEKEEAIREKEVHLKALDQKYEELIQMVPETQRQDLLSVRDRTRETMQKEIDAFRVSRQDCVRELDKARKLVETTRQDAKTLKQLVPRAMDALTEFGAWLPEDLPEVLG